MCKHSFCVCPVKQKAEEKRCKATNKKKISDVEDNGSAFRTVKTTVVDDDDIAINTAGAQAITSISAIAQTEFFWTMRQQPAI